MPNFAGSIPRVLNEKLGEHPSVLDFGCKMDAQRITDAAITSATTALTTSAKTITGASNTTPIVITTSAVHKYSTGYRLLQAGVGGNTAANGIFTIRVLSATTYELDGSVGNGAYSGGGTAKSAPFTAGNVGNLITVFGAGAAGADLSTTIAAYVSATAVTITAAASATVTAAECEFGSANATAFRVAVASTKYNGKRLYIPSGRMLLEDSITFPTEFHLYGAGRFSTEIAVTRNFPLAESGVFIGPGKVQGEFGEPGPIFEDFFVTFHQPDTNLPANFIQYPRAFDMRGTPAFQLRNIVVERGWIGVDMTPPNLHAITGASNATPIVITDVAHGFTTGDTVRIVDVLGNLGANHYQTAQTITVLTADTYSLNGSVGTGVYTAGTGKAMRTNAGVTTGAHAATFFNFGCGCYHKNIVLDQCFATIKMQGLYIWTYSFPDSLRGPLTNNQIGAFYQDTVIGIDVGRVDGLHVSDALINCGKPFYAHRGIDGFSSYGAFTNCHFDTTGNFVMEYGSFKLAGCLFTVSGPGYWGTAPEPTANSRNAIIQTGGLLIITSTVFFSRVSQLPIIDVDFKVSILPEGTGIEHHLQLTGCLFNQDNIDQPVIQVTGKVIAPIQLRPFTAGNSTGHVTISDCGFERRVDFTFTQPTIRVYNSDGTFPTYNPILVAVGNRSTGTTPTTGCAFISIDQDNWHVVKHNSIRGWKLSFPTIQQFGEYQEWGQYGSSGLTGREVWAQTYPGADFGAKVNAAIADLPLGGTVYLPASSEEVRTKIVVPRNVRLCGEGVNATTLTFGGAHASAAITFTGVPVNNETVTINGKVYTWKTTLTGASDEILIPATAAEAARNLYIAIKAFSLYLGGVVGLGTVEHTTCEPTDITSSGVLTVRFRAAGTGGNGTAVSETMANASWSGATMTGGTAAAGPAIVLADTTLGSGAFARGGLSDLTVIGPGTGAGTVGLYLGGDPASAYSPSTAYGDRSVIERVQITNFGVGVQWGNNSHSHTFYQLHNYGNGTDISVPGGLTNANFSENFVACEDGTSVYSILTNLSLNGVVFKSGTGSPETVVTAAPGTLYVRLDTPVPGRTLYYKESGTGNTGWVRRDAFTDDLVGLSSTELQSRAHLGATRLQMRQNGLDSGVDDSLSITSGGVMELHGGSGGLNAVRVYNKLGVGGDPPSIADSAYIKAWLGLNTTTRTGTGVLDVNGKSYFAADVELVGARLGVGTAPDASYYIKTPSLLATGGVKLNAETAGKAVYLDASKELKTSGASDLELGYLAGVSSAIQTQLNGKVDQVGVTGHTITLAKITAGGINGDLTWNGQGLITGYTDPT